MGNEKKGGKECGQGEERGGKKGGYEREKRIEVKKGSMEGEEELEGKEGCGKEVNEGTAGNEEEGKRIWGE